MINITRLNEVHYYEYPLQINYITKMQEKDKLLMKELMKSDNKYRLTKIERTTVLTLNGRIYLPVTIINSVIGYYIISTSAI
jgi:hypothetical protein